MAFWEDWCRKGCCDCDCDSDCSWKTLLFWAVLIAVIGGLLAVLIVAFAVVYPPTATADDALLTRLELTTGPPPASSTAGAATNSSTMSFNATVTLSLRNPNIHRGISYGPMPVTLSFNGSRFDDSATVRGFEQGAKKTTTVRLTVGGVDRPVRQLSAAGAAEFSREKDTGGRFAVEVRLDTVMQYKGRKAECPLVIICPLQLQLVDPDVAATAFQITKCTIVRAKKSGC